MALTHKPWSPSSAHRWRRCQVSETLYPEIPKNLLFLEEGESAIRGSLAQATLAARLLDLPPWLTNSTLEIDEIDAVQFAEDEIIRRRPQDMLKVEFFIEHTMDMTPIIGEGTGTLDFAYVVEGAEIEIIDYKHGAGVLIPADHEELALHAAGLAHELGKLVNDPIRGTRIREECRITTTIIQPRHWSDEPPVRSKTWDHDDLIRLLYELRDVRRRPKKDAVPGEHCLYCPSAIKCPAAWSAVHALVGQTTLSTSPKPKLTDYRAMTTMKQAEMALAWTNKQALNEMLKYAEASLLQRAKAGQLDETVPLTVETSSGRRSKPKTPAEERAAVSKLLAAGLTTDEIYKSDLEGVKALRQALMAKGKSLDEAEAILDTVFLPSESERLVAKPSMFEGLTFNSP